MIKEEEPTHGIKLKSDYNSVWIQKWIKHVFHRYVCTYLKGGKYRSARNGSIIIHHNQKLDVYSCIQKFAWLWVEAENHGTVQLELPTLTTDPENFQSCRKCNAVYDFVFAHLRSNSYDLRDSLFLFFNIQNWLEENGRKCNHNQMFTEYIDLALYLRPGMWKLGCFLDAHYWTQPIPATTHPLLANPTVQCLFTCLIIIHADCKVHTQYANSYWRMLLAHNRAHVDIYGSIILIYIWMVGHKCKYSYTHTDTAHSYECDQGTLLTKIWYWFYIQINIHGNALCL